MKKKILALCLVVVLAITAVTGATLAYFTDTDNATNTFTAGSVKIQLIEQERDASGEKLVDFSEKKLSPIVGSAQGEKDKWGLATAKNYVDKIVTVKNLADDAYVRVYIAIPAALEAPAPAGNVLHWNTGNKFAPKGDYTDGKLASDKQSKNADFVANMSDFVQLTGTTNIDGIDYNVYYFTYKKMLTKDEVTGSAFMAGLYLDQGVDAEERIVIDEDVGMVDGKWPTETVYTITKNGETVDIDFDLSNITIPVFAVGAQAAGFADETDADGNVTKCAADVAIDAAFGANYNPFA